MKTHSYYLFCQILLVIFTIFHTLTCNGTSGLFWEEILHTHVSFDLHRPNFATGSPCETKGNFRRVHRAPDPTRELGRGGGKNLGSLLHKNIFLSLSHLHCIYSVIYGAQSKEISNAGARSLSIYSSDDRSS